MKYGDKLKQIRESLKLSTNDVEKITGVYQSTVSKVENGKRRIDIEILKQILSAYNITLSEFFNEDTKSQTNNNSSDNDLNKFLENKTLQQECNYNYHKLTKEEKEKMISNLVFALKISLNLIKIKD